MQLNIKPQDLYYFDIYLRELLIAKPVNSLRSNGSIIEKTKGLQLIYEVKIKENGIDRSLIFDLLVRFQSFSEITEDIEPRLNFEEIDRPDLRPVKHSFAGELKIPSDFLELWNNFQLLPHDVRAAFISSCTCFQVAKEMNATNRGIAYLLFVTAIEVISNKVCKSRKPVTRFKDFICQSFDRSDSEFKAQLGRFYYERSNVLHNEGIGLDFMPIHGIISFQVISGTDLWKLEIIVNAAFIDFLKNPESFGVVLNPNT